MKKYNGSQDIDAITTQRSGQHKDKNRAMDRLSFHFFYLRRAAKIGRTITGVKQRIDSIMGFSVCFCRFGRNGSLPPLCLLSANQRDVVLVSSRKS